jgi:hypothetical protein
MNLSQRVSRRGLKGSIVMWMAFSLALATTVTAMPAQGHVCNGCHALSRALIEAAYAAEYPEPEAYIAPADPLLADAQAYDSASFTLSDSIVRFKAGTYNLWRIDVDTGQILKKRKVSFSTRVNFRTHHNLVKFGSYFYTQLLSGTWSGWYVRANNNAPGSSLTSFSDVRQVRMAKGTHTGVRFYNKTRVTVRRSATLDAADTFDVSRRAEFNNKVWFFVTSGPLAQRWVKRSSAVKLVSTTDSSSPSTSAGPPATWKGLLMIYRDTDVTFTRSDGSTYRLRARMSDKMYNLALDVVGRFVKSVGGWSDDYAAMDLKIVNVPRTLDRLEQLSNGKYWVGPKSVKSDMDKYAPSGTYDSIIVLWEAKDSKGVIVPVGGWGLALPPGSWANGAGYASIHTPTEMWWWTDSKHPQEVFVHEWMHQVLFFHEAAKRIKLDLHSEAKYGYKSDNGSFKSWHSDVMRGRVWDGSKYIGVNYEMWRAGTPTRPNGWN